MMRAEFLTKAEREREAWAGVVDALDRSHLVAWDCCHKIYIALDEKTANWFAKNYDETARGTLGEKLAAVEFWYRHSCSLRFVSSVVTGYRGDDYIELIPQGFDEFCDPCAFCGYSDCDGVECDEAEL
jgi:hypothetical protein